jgi:hypothetical protein
MNPAEGIKKLQKLAKVLKFAMSNLRFVTKQEEHAIKTAIKIKEMHRDKFKKLQKEAKSKTKTKTKTKKRTREKEL